jgi:hypothetical protein
MRVFAAGIDEHKLIFESVEPFKCARLVAYLVWLQFAVIVGIMYNQGIGAERRVRSCSRRYPPELTRTQPRVHMRAFLTPR